MTCTKRWVLVNKKSGQHRTARHTREDARAAKRSTERIFDSVKGNYIR